MESLNRLKALNRIIFWDPNDLYRAATETPKPFGEQGKPELRRCNELGQRRMGGKEAEKSSLGSAEDATEQRSRKALFM